MQDAGSLGSFLLEEPIVPRSSFLGGTILTQETGRLSAQLTEVHDKLTRLIHKGVAAILDRQERIEEEWLAQGE
jgi:hypothetical protein